MPAGRRAKRRQKLPAPGHANCKKYELLFFIFIQKIM